MSEMDDGQVTTSRSQCVGSGSKGGRHFHESNNNKGPGIHPVNTAGANKMVLSRLEDQLGRLEINDDQDNEDEEEATPRLFPNVSEDEDDDDVFTFSKRALSRSSGAWSGFSWTSLYEEGGLHGDDGDHGNVSGREDAESSLSWADEEMERETTERVAKMFRQIDDELYQDGSSSSSTSSRTPTPSRIPKMSEALKEECAIWRAKFPHLRIKGRSVKIWPAEDANLESEINNLVPKEELEDEEEVFAYHNDDADNNTSDSVGGSGLEGLHLNERFEEDPQGYLAEKVMSAVFHRVWSSLVPEEVSGLADVYGQRIIQESMEMQSLSSRESSAVVTNRLRSGRNRNNSSSNSSSNSSNIRLSSAASNRAGTASRYGNRRETAIDAIDENAVFQGGGAKSRLIRVDHLDHEDGTNSEHNPISLPNLASNTGRHELASRPFSSQVSGRGLSGRRQRTSSFTRGDRKTSPDRTSNNPPATSSSSPPNKTFNRMRSHSGSPPRGRMAKQQQQQQQQQHTFVQRPQVASASHANRHQQMSRRLPISLPPIIQGVTAPSSSAAAIPRVSSSMAPHLSRLGGAGATIGSGATTASSAKLLNRRGTSAAPIEAGGAVNFSVAGRRLNSIKSPNMANKEEGRSLSRMSNSGSAHWDFRVSSAASTSARSRANSNNNRL